MSANHTAPNQRDKIIRKVSYSLSHIPRRRLEYPHASTNCDKPISSFSLIFCKGTTKIAHMQISAQKSFGNLHFFCIFLLYLLRCPFLRRTMPVSLLSFIKCLLSIATAKSRILLSFQAFAKRRSSPFFVLQVDIIHRSPSFCLSNADIIYNARCHPPTDGLSQRQTPSPDYL